MAASVAGAAPLGKGLDISLAALQRHDPYIGSILDVASQVALYTFGHRANEWVRERSAIPGRWWGSVRKTEESVAVVPVP